MEALSSFFFSFSYLSFRPNRYLGTVQPPDLPRDLRPPLSNGASDLPESPQPQSIYHDLFIAHLVSQRHYLFQAPSIRTRQQICTNRTLPQ